MAPPIFAITRGGGMIPGMVPSMGLRRPSANMAKEAARRCQAAAEAEVMSPSLSARFTPHFLAFDRGLFSDFKLAFNSQRAIPAAPRVIFDASAILSSCGIDEAARGSRRQHATDFVPHVMGRSCRRRTVGLALRGFLRRFAMPLRDAALMIYDRIDAQRPVYRAARHSCGACARDACPCRADNRRYLAFPGSFSFEEMPLQHTSRRVYVTGNFLKRVASNSERSADGAMRQPPDYDYRHDAPRQAALARAQVCRDGFTLLAWLAATSQCSHIF